MTGPSMILHLDDDSLSQLCTFLSAEDVLNLEQCCRSLYSRLHERTRSRLINCYHFHHIVSPGIRFRFGCIDTSNSFLRVAIVAGKVLFPCHIPVFIIREAVQARLVHAQELLSRPKKRLRHFRVARTFHWRALQIALLYSQFDLVLDVLHKADVMFCERLHRQASDMSQVVVGELAIGGEWCVCCHDFHTNGTADVTTKREPARIECYQYFLKSRWDTTESGEDRHLDKREVSCRRWLLETFAESSLHDCWRLAHNCMNLLRRIGYVGPLPRLAAMPHFHLRSSICCMPFEVLQMDGAGEGDAWTNDQEARSCCIII